MTIDEFNNTLFYAGMMVEVRPNKAEPMVRRLISPNFDQALIGIRLDENDEEEPLSWFRCENCTIIEEP